MSNVTDLLSSTKSLIAARNDKAAALNGLKKHAPATFKIQRIINLVQGQIDDLQADIDANIALAEMEIAR